MDIINNINTLCSSCKLPIKEYKQNIQEREDICENCFIADVTDDFFQEDSEQDIYL